MSKTIMQEKIQSGKKCAVKGYNEGDYARTENFPGGRL
jgi:hypothetical protein